MRCRYRSSQGRCSGTLKAAKRKAKAAMKGTMLRAGVCQYDRHGNPRRCYQLMVSRGGRLTWKKVSIDRAFPRAPTPAPAPATPTSGITASPTMDEEF